MNRFELAKRIRKSGASPVAKAVGASIVSRFIDSKGFACVSVPEIAKELNRSTKTIRNAINELVSHNIITKHKTARASLYRAAEIKASDIIEWKHIATLKDHRDIRKERKNRKYPRHIIEDKLNSEWREYFPQFAHLSDAEFKQDCRDLSIDAALSDATGWTMEECRGSHFDWIKAQIDTIALTKTDGINGGRFMSYCPIYENEEYEEAYTKQMEFHLGF